MGIGVLPAMASGPAIATRTISVYGVSDDSMIDAAYQASQALRVAEYATSAGAAGGTSVPNVNAATGFNVNEAIGFTLPAPGDAVVSTPNVNAATGFNVNAATGFTLTAPGYAVVSTPDVNAATGFTLP